MPETIAVGKGNEATRFSRRVWIAIALMVLVLVAWGLIGWDWSTVDDAGQILALRARIAEVGPLAGPLVYVGDMFQSDRTWGLFRPMYWIYPSAFYLLPASVAHVVRLAMVLIAIAGPIAHVRRSGLGRPTTWMAGILIAAAASGLYVGLFLVSLQELSGAALIGLGLMSRRVWVRTACWTAAAWFKAPFAWLLVGHAVVLWRRGQRSAALTNAAIGVLTLGLAVAMARSGQYTSDYVLSPGRMLSSASKLLDTPFLLLLLSVVWWLAATRSRLEPRSDTVMFGIAWVGYTVQLLPWNLSAYYIGPILYLFGLVLISMLTATAGLSLPRTLAAFSIPVVTAAYLVVVPVKDAIRSNQIVAGIGACLERYPGTTTAIAGGYPYVTGSAESPIRLVQNIQLRDPSWRGSIVLETEDAAGFRDPATNLYAVMPGGTLPSGRSGREVCRAGLAIIYRLGA